MSNRSDNDRVIRLSVDEQNVILLGLCLALELIFSHSKYPEPIKRKLKAVIEKLAHRIRNPEPSEHDSYGNPY